MLNDEKRKELKDKLEAFHVWPSIYVYKFIFKSDDQKLSELKSKFPEEVEFSLKSSSGGKYTSITIKEMVLHADTIFQRYEDVSEIKGIISL
jgi:putative lipoic acid-binding regulatory protein